MRASFNNRTDRDLVEQEANEEKKTNADSFVDDGSPAVHRLA